MQMKKKIFKHDIPAFLNIDLELKECQMYVQTNKVVGHTF